MKIEHRVEDNEFGIPKPELDGVKGEIKMCIVVHGENGWVVMPYSGDLPKMPIKDLENVKSIPYSVWNTEWDLSRNIIEIVGKDPIGELVGRYNSAVYEKRREAEKAAKEASPPEETT